MSDLRALTLEQFALTVGQSFAVDQPDAPSIELVLSEAQPLGPAPAADAPAAARRPFALVFGGPAEPRLAQQIVPLRHAALGRLEIFLVPIAADADGVRYEAVFA